MKLTNGIFRLGMTALALFFIAALAGCGGGGNPATDFKWQINESGGVTITEYVGQSQGVKIPAKIEGKRVTAIGLGAFANAQLNSLTIPHSVTSIGHYAFQNNRLTSVTIPDSVTEIGAYAFENNQLTGVTIPASVTSVSGSVFSRNQITTIVMPAAFAQFPDLGFPDSFDNSYGGNGRKAGTYTRPSADSNNWTYNQGKSAKAAPKNNAASQKALQGTWVAIQEDDFTIELIFQGNEYVIKVGPNEPMGPFPFSITGDELTFFVEDNSFSSPYALKGRDLTIYEFDTGGTVVLQKQ